MDLQPSALTLAIALAAGAAAQSLASQVRLPGIVLLLAAGAALGPELAGWVDPSALGGGLVHLVEFGVAVVLFQGGLNLDLGHLRRQESAIWRLVSAGALGTLAGAAILARFVLEWEWRTAVLFGSVVVVTGQTVVGPLLHGIGLRRRTRTLLEAEAVLLDPIGALLATLVLQAVTVPAVGALASEAVAVAGSIAFGLLAGIVVGLVLAGAVRTRIAVAAGYESVVGVDGRRPRLRAVRPPGAAERPHRGRRGRRRLRQHVPHRRLRAAHVHQSADGRAGGGPSSCCWPRTCR